MNNKEVISEIRRKCGTVTKLNNGWNLFMYRYLHYVYIPNDKDNMIRIIIPHIANSNDYKEKVLKETINEVNREVKFVKAMVLLNGSISLNYDHRVTDNVREIVSHMIETLNIGARYLLTRLQSNIELMPHKR